MRKGTWLSRQLEAATNVTAFSMGLPSMEPDRIIVFAVIEDYKIETYHGYFVRHFENGGVVIRDDKLGCVCLPSAAKWRYEAS